MNGWNIMLQSWSVLRRDKSLVVFPILSGIACLLVAGSFVIPFVAAPELLGGLQQLFNRQPGANQAPNAVAMQIISYVLLFLFYFANYFVITFFNTALVSCAIIRFQGGTPTVRDGINAALSRLPQILGWALLAATVGMLLRALEERLGLLGRFVVGLIGLAWSVATYLVVPVLAVERLGPTDALKRSVSLLTKCWGEGIVGNLSMGLLHLLLMLPVVVLVMVGVGACVAANHFWPALLIGAIAAVYLVTVAIVFSTLQQIFLAGLYVYAAEDRIPAGFDEESLARAFKRKKQ